MVRKHTLLLLLLPSWMIRGGLERGARLVGLCSTCFNYCCLAVVAIFCKSQKWKGSIMTSSRATLSVNLLGQSSTPIFQSLVRYAWPFGHLLDMKPSISVRPFLFFLTFLVVWVISGMESLALFPPPFLTIPPFDASSKPAPPPKPQHAESPSPNKKKNKYKQRLLEAGE